MEQPAQATGCCFLPCKCVIIKVNPHPTQLNGISFLYYEYVGEQDALSYKAFPLEFAFLSFFLYNISR